MTRFTELLKTGEVHSAYEDVNMTTSVPDTAPASVEDLVKMMVDSDLQLAKRESVLINEGLIEPTWENPTN